MMRGSPACDVMRPNCPELKLVAGFPPVVAWARAVLVVSRRIRVPSEKCVRNRFIGLLQSCESEPEL